MILQTQFFSSVGFFGILGLCMHGLLALLSLYVLYQVSSCGETLADDCHGFPTLCSATFVVWYRELVRLAVRSQSWKSNLFFMLSWKRDEWFVEISPSFQDFFLSYSVIHHLRNWIPWNCEKVIEHHSKSFFSHFPILRSNTPLFPIYIIYFVYCFSMELLAEGDSMVQHEENLGILNKLVSYIYT